MKLNHTSVSAVIPAGAANVLVQNFGFVQVGKPDEQRCIVRPKDGGPAVEINKAKEVGVKNGHVGFTFEKRAHAIEKFRQLKRCITNYDSVHLPSTKSSSTPGYFSFYINGGLVIEFGWGDYLAEAH